MMNLNHRYEFVYLFDVKDGNPNGDPDAGNMPRIDVETGQGLVTDVCLKRKVRNYIGIIKGEEPPFEIYVKEKAVLNRNNDRAYKALKLKPESKKLPKDIEEAKNLTAWMCHNFFDIRTFGAVMTTEINTGQVRGPIQLNFSRSIDPVVSAEHSITRMAVTNEKDLEKERTMGRKFTIPYGLYRCHGYVSAHLAKQTGFSESDLELFWQALINMFDYDRSASHGEMSACRLYVFKHVNILGNAPARKLFDCVDVKKSSEGPARNFNDYKVIVHEDNLPSGVEILTLLG
nr:type I-C CRISPR-associated protein Cas7/Csd2 [uncultured Tolumonas sp.]